MKYALKFLPLLLLGCATIRQSNPEKLFTEHVAYMKTLPIEDGDEPVVAKGVHDDKSTRHIIELLTRKGVALVREKAENGTLEERIVATRLYAWYAGGAMHARISYPWQRTADFNKFLQKCTDLVDEEKAIQLHQRIDPLQIPEDLAYTYEGSVMIVRDLLANRPENSEASR